MSETTVMAEVTFRYPKYRDAFFDLFSAVQENRKSQSTLQVNQHEIFQNYKLGEVALLNPEEIDVDIEVSKIEKKSLFLFLHGWWASTPDAWNTVYKHAKENFALTQFFLVEHNDKMGTFSVEAYEKKKSRFEIIDDEEIFDEIIESENAFDTLKNAYSQKRILQRSNDHKANIIHFCQKEELIPYVGFFDERLTSEQRKIIDRITDEIAMFGSNNINETNAKGELLINEVFKSTNYGWLYEDICNFMGSPDFETLDVYGESALGIIEKFDLRDIWARGLVTECMHRCEEKPIDQTSVEDAIWDASRSNILSQYGCSSPANDWEIDKDPALLHKDYKSLTPLMVASLYNSISAMECMVFHNVDLNVQDNKGWTALFYGVSSRKLEPVEFLVKNGADINIKNKAGMTVLEYAKRRKSYHIIEFLESRSE